MNLSELEKKREELVTNFFWLALYIALIFGIPAFLAIFIGYKINDAFNFKGAEFVLLFIAFVSSWLIVVFEYKKKTKLLRELGQKIKEARLLEKK